VVGEKVEKEPQAPMIEEGEEPEAPMVV